MTGRDGRLIVRLTTQPPP